MAQTRNKVLGKKFCDCVKSVRRYVKPKTGTGTSAKEGAAIAICTKSVLQTRGKTLRKFSCKKRAKLQTQRLKQGSD
jgi:hypothetical protein